MAPQLRCRAFWIRSHADRKLKDQGVAVTDSRMPEKAKDNVVKAVGNLARFARESSVKVGVQAADVKGAAADTVERFTTKKADPYTEAIADYNDAFTSMSDKGVALLGQRDRSTDLIGFIELLVNSVANTPKSFDADFEQITAARSDFLAAEEFARRDLNAARRSAMSVGAGVTTGAAVASLAPTAALWVATTFGAASTGTAISTLSGVAATNAALAWLGGGTLAAGGGGAAAGGALLALAGPVGWTIAGAGLLASIALFTKKKLENREAREEALTAVKTNTAAVRGMDAEIGDLLTKTTSVRASLAKTYGEALSTYGHDYLSLTSPQQSQLIALVNNTKSSAALLGRRLERGVDDA
jgi:hypothetical protein